MLRDPALLVIALLALGAGCGGDAKPVAKDTKKKPGGSAAPATPAGDKTATPRIRAKAPDAERRPFIAEEFTADVTGLVRRDPFRSFLASPPPDTSGGTGVQDECANRTLAENFAINELELIGIVVRGTRNFGMFRDKSGVGHIAYANDCLSKDKVKVLEITNSCVRLGLRGEAPPGAAAPPAREDVRCLDRAMGLLQ